jgi:hypothetical protein
MHERPSHPGLGKVKCGGNSPQPGPSASSRKSSSAGERVPRPGQLPRAWTQRSCGRHRARRRAVRAVGVYRLLAYLRDRLADRALYHSWTSSTPWQSAWRRRAHSPRRSRGSCSSAPRRTASRGSAASDRGPPEGHGRRRQKTTLSWQTGTRSAWAGRRGDDRSVTHSRVTPDVRAPDEARWPEPTPARPSLRQGDAEADDRATEAPAGWKSAHAERPGSCFRLMQGRAMAPASPFDRASWRRDADRPLAHHARRRLAEVKPSRFLARSPGRVVPARRTDLRWGRRGHWPPSR